MVQKKTTISPTIKTNMENLIELLKTTLIKEVKMSFGYLLSTVVIVMLLTMCAAIIGIAFAF